MQAKFFNTLKLSTVFGLIGASLLFVQCKKDPTEGQVKLTYLTTGHIVEGATVTFTIGDSAGGQGFFLCDEGFVTEKSYTTNSSGTITECFELPALITVNAFFQDATFLDTTGLDSAAAAAAVAATIVRGEGKLNLIEHEKTSIEIKMN